MSTEPKIHQWRRDSARVWRLWAAMLVCMSSASLAGAVIAARHGFVGTSVPFAIGALFHGWYAVAGFRKAAALLRGDPV